MCRQPYQKDSLTLTSKEILVKECFGVSTIASEPNQRIKTEVEK